MPSTGLLQCLSAYSSTSWTSSLTPHSHPSRAIPYPQPRTCTPTPTPHPQSSPHAFILGAPASNCLRIGGDASRPAKAKHKSASFLCSGRILLPCCSFLETSPPVVWQVDGPGLGLKVKRQQVPTLSHGVQEHRVSRLNCMN